MCGIFGLIVSPNSEINSGSVKRILEKIAVFSESRGKDSSGLALRDMSTQSIHILKGDIPIRDLIESKPVRNSLNESIKSYETGNGFAAFGHARLVTNGTQLNEVNNQPVIKDGVILIHNGIIVNNDQLWEDHIEIERKYSIDTEIIPALLRMELLKFSDLGKACYNAFAKLKGTFSVAAMFDDIDRFLLATNNGSIYYITDHKKFICFASEAYFLKRLVNESVFADFGKNTVIKQLSADKGIVISLSEFSIEMININDYTLSVPLNFQDKYEIRKTVLDNKKNKREVVIDPAIFIDRSKEGQLLELLEFNINAISRLKRCSKCLLPQTFPYIIYDDKGVCNYCNNYKPKNLVHSLADLQHLVEPYRKKDGSPDCIVPFSGGRDSTYSLHIIKKELGLNPIALTYDWGMVTDLARRNIARVCGKLGVENIIVSADIHWKRENIRKNVGAWLKSPSLGMIPLFMAGDKFFFYYTDRLKKQTGINLNIWGINHLENTEFKIGFAGIPPQFDKKRIYSLSLMNQFKLFAYVGKNIIDSPGYINMSVFDSLGSFASRYIAPKRDYYHLFDYYPWDENEVNELIKNEYEWETAIDTHSTWRIGDGTASFYNYIYYTVAGFSENDTFRSNQIREGMITRDKALQLVQEENQPRYETLRWYLDIIGLDFTEVIKKVNSIPKLYPFV